jgi:biotin transport system substrate-specific component
MAMRRFDIRSMALCALFASLLMAGAFIRIPLPVVPFTLQTLFLFLAGLTLGPALGLSAAALYMAAGLLGLPVFANGGGIHYVLAPSFGYILAFCPASYVIGRLARRRAGGLWYYAACCFAGLMVVYVVGASYLAAILGIHLQQSVSFWRIAYSGALIFLPGDALACFLAAVVYTRLPAGMRNADRTR